MKNIKTQIYRRSFIKVSALAGGGMDFATDGREARLSLSGTMNVHAISNRVARL